MKWEKNQLNYSTLQGNNIPGIFMSGGEYYAKNDSNFNKIGSIPEDSSQTILYYVIPNFYFKFISWLK